MLVKVYKGRGSRQRFQSACGDAPSDGFLAGAIQSIARSGRFSVEAGTRAAAPFPAPLSPLAALCHRCAPHKFLLTKTNTFQHKLRRNPQLRKAPGRAGATSRWLLSNRISIGKEGPTVPDWRQLCRGVEGVSVDGDGVEVATTAGRQRIAVRESAETFELTGIVARPDCDRRYSKRCAPSLASQPGDATGGV